MKLTFLNVLTLIFIVLKLTDVIGWSWWLVLSPMLIPIAIISIVIVSAVVLCIFKLFIVLINSDEKRK